MNTHNLQRIGLMLAGLLLTAACQSAAAQTAATPAPAIAAATPAIQQAGAPGAAPAAVPTRVVTANTSVAVDGALALATPLISVSFETSGKVTAVNVVPGQTVKKGDVLAELDATALNTALQQAQDQLALKQAQIASSLSPAKQTDIDTAKASLAAAYAAYNELKQGPDANTVDQALRSWNQAKNSLYQAQLNRASTCGFGANPSDDEVKKAMGDPHCKQADLSVQSADLRERAAYQSYLDAQAPSTQDELTKAYASVVQAQSSLATLQNGVSADQKAVYDLQLKQAQLTVDRASRNLAQATLIAPCDCTVQEVGLSVGAAANGSVTLLDTAQLKFATSNLDEQDVVKLKAGQTATIRLKAFDQTFTGKVGAVLPLSSGTQGTVSLYTVLIDLDSTSAALLPGMTGQAEINLQ